jgi:hypothetical protein
MIETCMRRMDDSNQTCIRTMETMIMKEQKKAEIPNASPSVANGIARTTSVQPSPVKRVACRV